MTNPLGQAPAGRTPERTHTPIPLTVGGTDMRLDAFHREGEGIPLVFLHGFGSTKEDYADVCHRPEFAGRPVLAYDAPGCGRSWIADPAVVTVEFLVATLEAMLERFGYERVHLVGHSMGGLTSLVFACTRPHRVAGFVDIEGTLAPEDCFLSRQIHDYPADDPDSVMDAFEQRAWESAEYGSAMYATTVRLRVRPDAVRPIFTSMVELSDHGGLLEEFLALPFPRMFIHGEQNAELSYLGTLAANGVEVASIPDSGHWPMYSNAPELWRRLDGFLSTVEA